MEFEVRPVREDDWRELRAQRLEMLADTPIAFGDTLAVAERRPEEYWRNRARSADTDASIRLAAIAADGSWLGTMGCIATSAEPDPVLVGVYVSPVYRGTGVTDALLAAVESWAAARATRLILFVREDNDHAIASYRRRGFVETGRTLPYELDPTFAEIEMVKSLA